MFVDGFLDLYERGVLRREVEGGAVAHAAFFLGPRSFYERLRRLDPADRARFQMKSVSFVNQLWPDTELKMRQRRDARFLNTALKVTLGGAAASDGLADGRVLSGVGGQHDFVCMAQDLADARSVILIRSTRESRGRVDSNVVWNYGHTTIPRHLRDVVVTEYGIADLRGRSDREVIEALLAVSDARFQEGLARAAVEAGKLPRGYRLPDRARGNTPERLERTLAPQRAAGLLPRLPFGSVMTEVEWTLAADLRALSEAWKGKRGLVPGRRELAACLKAPADAAPYLERMGLEHPVGPRQRLLRLATLYALARRGSIGAGPWTGS
jgi:acyl-CoA hydrolase